MRLCGQGVGATGGRVAGLGDGDQGLVALELVATVLAEDLRYQALILEVLKLAPVGIRAPEVLLPPVLEVEPL